MQLAKRPVETLASPFKPDQYEDGYRKNFERLIDESVRSRNHAVKQPGPAKVVDILKALKCGLESQCYARETRCEEGCQKKRARRPPERAHSCNQNPLTREACAQLRVINAGGTTRLPAGLPGMLRSS